MLGKDLWALAIIKEEYIDYGNAPYRAWIKMENMEFDGSGDLCTFLEFQTITQPPMQNKAYLDKIELVQPMEFYTEAELKDYVENIRRRYFDN